MKVLGLELPKIRSLLLLCLGILWEPCPLYRAYRAEHRGVSPLGGPLAASARRAVFGSRAENTCVLALDRGAPTGEDVRLDSLQEVFSDT